MSSVLSCATLLFIIFVSFQNGTLCARPRALDATSEIVYDEDSSQKSNQTDTTKDDLKTNLTDSHGTSKRQVALGKRQQPASSTIGKSIDKKDSMEVREMATSQNRHSSTKHSSRKRITYLARLGSKTGGGGGTAVTYRVPHPKRGEQQPGFNLDYSPPKVHPPHHN